VDPPEPKLFGKDPSHFFRDDGRLILSVSKSERASFLVTQVEELL